MTGWLLARGLILTLRSQGHVLLQAKQYRSVDSWSLDPDRFASLATTLKIASLRPQ